MNSMEQSLCTFALAAAEAWCRARGRRKLSTLALEAAGNADFFDRMRPETRGGFSLAVYDRAITYMFNTWPPGAVWPSPPRWPYSRPAGEINASTEGKQEQAEGRRRRCKGARRRSEGGEVA